MEKIIVKVDNIKKLKVDPEERETTISFDSENEKAILFTSDPKVVTDMKFKMKSNPESFTCYEGDYDMEGNLTSYWFEFSKDLVYIYAKKRTHNRVWSEEDKQKVSERFKKHDS